MRSTWLIAGVAASLTLLAAPVTANAQGYPDKLVRFVVPYTAGGPTDIIARVLSEKLAATWKQPTLVENRPGAGSNTGSAGVARSTADGYTLLVNTTAVAVNASLFKAPGYDILKDLIAVTNVAQSPNIIVAGKSLKASNLKDGLAEARAGQYSYGSPGTGTTPHLSAEYLFKVLAKVDVRHVPYKGGGDMMNATLTGEVQFGTSAVPGAFALVSSGQVRGLAVTSVKRLASLPSVPTIAESGFPGFEDYTWIGVFAPAGTPKPIVVKLNSHISAVLKAPDVRARLDKIGFDVIGNSSEDFTAALVREVAKWGKVVREIGVTPQ